MTQEFVTLPREVVDQIISAFDADMVTSSGWKKNTAAALRAALEQPQNHVPDVGNMVQAGWKLVPVEPTIRQMAAMGPAIRACYDMDGVSGNVIDVYRAMLAAAPKPPTTEQSSAVQSQVEQEPVAEHELKDVRCECCGYMTHHREHMGCIRAAQPKREPLTDEQVPSPTAGMNIAQRILHVGGRNNAAGYVEFGGIQAVEALVLQVLRDLPQHREPMTDAEIADLLIDLPVLGTGYFLRIARAIEAAHNIK